MLIFILLIKFIQFNIAGIEIPKCNFVTRYDFPKSYRSYVQCKSRARAPDALHVLLVEDNTSKEYVWQLAQYHYIEKVCIIKLSSTTGNNKT